MKEMTYLPHLAQQRIYFSSTNVSSLVTVNSVLFIIIILKYGFIRLC